jgi:hypothetical protein
MQSKPTRSPTKGQYSLMPTLDAPRSRRGSESKSNLYPNPTGPATHTRSRAGSQSTASSTHPSEVRNSILDEVEGTLTATITELQELQGTWHPGSRHPRTQDQTSASPSVVSSNGRTASRDGNAVQPAKSYFPPPGTQSMPHTPNKGTAYHLEQGSAESRLQSWQQAYNEQKKQAHAILMENDNAKKRLDFMKARLAEFEEEKAALVSLVKEAEENLQNMLGRLREAKVGELAAQNEFHAAKNEVSILQAKYDAVKAELELQQKCTEQLQDKLEEVNTQKVDLLERELETRQEAIVVKKQLKQAVEELKNSQPSTPVDFSLEKRLEEAERRNALLEAEIKKLSPSSDLPSVVASITFKLEDMSRKLVEKDALIDKLRRQNADAAQTISSLEADKAKLPAVSRRENSPARLAPAPPISPSRLSRKLEETREELCKARGERDQFAQLLHAEIRRTTVDEHGSSHPSAGFLRKKLDLDEAVAVARERAQKYIQGGGGGGGGAPAAATAAGTGAGGKVGVEHLEREIEYYLNDIVLYKLDVKGYRKDLRRAREQINELSQRGRVDSLGSSSSGGNTVTGV